MDQEKITKQELASSASQQELLFIIKGVSKWNMAPIVVLTCLGMYLNYEELGILFYVSMGIGLLLSAFVGYAAQEYPTRNITIAEDFIKISTKEKRRVISPGEIKNLHVGSNRVVIITDTKNAIIPFNMTPESKRKQLRKALMEFCDRHDVLFLS